MTDKLFSMLKSRGRYVVAFLSLSIAFVLSVQFSDRGFEFDLRQTPLSASEADGDQSDDYKLSELTILNRALLQIKDSYVEPDRVEPTTMLAAALDEGLLTIGCGQRTLRILPPLDVTEREIRLGADLLETAIHAAA